MGEESKFQQQWAFRKRDNEFESSTEDSDSRSSSEPVLKKHKLVAGFVPCNDDNTNHSPSLQLNHDENKLGKSNKVQHGGRSKKDNLTFSYEPVVALTDLKMFMGSLLDDLKGSREKLCSWMKDEMHKLVEDGNVDALKQKKHSESQVKVKRPIKSKKADTSDQNHHQQVHSNFDLIARAQNCNGHGDLDQVGRFITSTLPTVSTEPCFEHNKLDVPPYNYMQSGRLNTMLDASACRQYFPSLQQQERFRNFAPTSSRSITQNSMTGNGLDSGFSIPSQVSLDNPSRAILGLRLNGGIVNHALPRQYFPNNFNTHLNYRLDSGFSSFQAPSFKDGPK